MKACNHARAGIVTNQPGTYDSNQPHASRQTCARDECIKITESWVASKTNQTAYFIPDADRSVRL